MWYATSTGHTTPQDYFGLLGYLGWKRHPFFSQHDPSSECFRHALGQRRTVRSRIMSPLQRDFEVPTKGFEFWTFPTTNALVYAHLIVQKRGACNNFFKSGHSILSRRAALPNTRYKSNAAL